jgi:hypothetical protein
MKGYLKFGMLAVLAFIFSIQAVFARRGFAIVVDPISYQKAKAEITDYGRAIEKVNGLKVYYVIDKWNVPDSIRCQLIRLHSRKSEPIEGAVFIGDIPIAMIRDAQHLTSAFKMNQLHSRKESSVPSDRFYDDFGLKFKYIGHDSDAPYYYYSLTSDSRQFLQPDIFTGRIRPTDANGVSRYEKLRLFLRKAVNEKRQHNKLDQMLYFNGHGYISESLQARIDEKQGLYEHFPWLHQQKNGISYISHTSQDVTKFFLMNELQRPELDFAILHHHGAPDTEYMDGAPKIVTAARAEEFIKAYCRGYLRRAVERHKDKDSVMAVIEKKYNIPESWLSDTFDKNVMHKDSIDDANEDLTIPDFKIYGYRPNCRFITIDACFNGSFQLDDCIADEYIFNPGKTVAVVANSVNVLQDKWNDRYMGLIGLGAYVGNIPRFCGYLESQLIGDPTFAFTPAVKTVDVNSLLAANDYKIWKKYLHDYSLPDMMSMAINQYHRAGKLSSEELLKYMENPKSSLVRVEALNDLADIRDDNFIKALELGADDSYEFVQRSALNYIGKSGDERLIPTLIKVAITNNVSPRCNFSCENALTMFPEDKLLSEFNRQFWNPNVSYLQKNKVGKTIQNAISSCATKWTEDIDAAVNPLTTKKIRMRAIRTSRNYCPPYSVPKLIAYFQTCKDPDIQTMILESLGWRNYSFMASTIAKFAREISQNNRYDANVRNEALKTYNRVR